MLIVVFVWGLAGKQERSKSGKRRTSLYIRSVDSPAFEALLPESQLLFRLQRSTVVQVRSSVRMMPQNQPSGRGLLPSPTAWSPDQHPVAMLDDVSRHTLGRTEGRGLGFGQLVRTHKWKCLKCQSSSDGHSDHNALCAGGR